MGANYEGLSSEEVNTLLAKYGKNVLPEKPPPSKIKIFLDQIKSPLVYILLIAGVITFFLREYTDTIIISLAVFINTVLGFVQEKRAGDALMALKGMLKPEAEVIRDGKRVIVQVEDIVPGDVVVLNQGDKIPADGVLLSANRFFVDEAILTGESLTVSKFGKSEVYMGTIVTSGQGFMKVVKTGERTKMGEIALSVQEPSEDTPLRKQLKKFSSQLSLVVLILTIGVFVIGIVSGLPLSEVFVVSVALAVSAIPEGLLVALTVILAIGMQRILKQRGLVHSLVSAETLGGVTTICADKTGTLTQGKMRVVKLVGDRKLMAKQAILSNDHDDPIVNAAWEWAEKELTSKDLKGEKIDGYLTKHARIDGIPFSSEDRFAATLHKWNDKKNVMFVNGAPDFLLEWCDLSKGEKEDLLKVIEELTSNGMRLLGMARKDIKPESKVINKKNITKNLEWVGILAFTDPVREDVKPAFEMAKKAGIRTMIITGDYPQTALAVVKAIGISISKNDVILGDELARMHTDELAKTLLGREPMLFARTTPEQKLKIVKALKANGEVVAMTGDGVNDAPALAQADIGIAVAEASDVSKESADLVLLDSKFNTIVMTIEEGRGIFDNIRRVTLYLLSGAFSEIITVVVAIVLGLPLPITATQILWINLVSDGFPSLALTIDPKRREAMNEPPRNPSVPLVNRWMMLLIALVSSFSAASALCLFWYVNKTTGDVILARSTAFATIGMNSLIYVFSIRALKAPIWKEHPFSNKWLIIGVVGGILLQVFPFVLPKTREFFKVSFIPLEYWIYIIFLTMIMLILIEVFKIILRKGGD